MKTTTNRPTYSSLIKVAEKVTVDQLNAILADNRECSIFMARKVRRNSSYVRIFLRKENFSMVEYRYWTRDGYNAHGVSSVGDPTGISEPTVFLLQDGRVIAA